MPNVKIKVIIEYKGKKKILTDEVEDDKDEIGLYGFCHQSDFGFNIQDEVARMLGTEVPDV